LAKEHEDGTPNEERAAAESLDGPERDRGGKDVDKGGDQTDDERVGDRTEGLEERGTKIEDEVDTSPLLHHLNRGTENGSPQVGSRVTEAAGETTGPGSPVAAVRDNGHFVLVVGDDFGELVLDQFRVLWLTTDAAEDVSGLGIVALLDKVSGRLGEEEETDSKDDCPEELNGDRNPVRTRIGPVLGGVGDAGGEQ